MLMLCRGLLQGAGHRLHSRTSSSPSAGDLAAVTTMTRPWGGRCLALSPCR